MFEHSFNSTKVQISQEEERTFYSSSNGSQSFSLSVCLSGLHVVLLSITNSNTRHLPPPASEASRLDSSVDDSPTVSRYHPAGVRTFAPRTMAPGQKPPDKHPPDTCPRNKLLSGRLLSGGRRFSGGRISVILSRQTFHVHADRWGGEESPDQEV